MPPAEERLSCPGESGSIGPVDPSLTSGLKQQALQDTYAKEDNDWRNVHVAQRWDSTANRLQDWLGDLVKEIDDLIGAIDIGKPGKDDPGQQDQAIESQKVVEQAGDFVGHLHSFAKP